MKSIDRKLTSVLLLTTTCCLDAVGQSAETGTLTIDTDTPVVRIEARAAGRSFVRLPSLDYVIQLNPQCAAGLKPRAISLSVADTRKSLATDDISGESATASTFTIPGSQIGPIAMKDFCIAEAGEQESPQTSQNQSDRDQKVTIASVVSLQASLLCASETESRMTYASRGLDVILECELPRETRDEMSN